MRRLTILLSLWCLCTSYAASQMFAGRETILFNRDWKFYKGAINGAEKNDFDDKKWQTVHLPHDWSIEDLPLIDDSEKLIVNLSIGKWKFLRGDNPEWSSYNAFEGNWDVVEVPAFWNTYPFPDVNPNWAWFRRSIGIAEENRGKEVWLNLGKIADANEVFFNGKLIASSGSMPPAFVSASREERLYKVPATQINYNGRNVVAVRVYSEKGKGGIYDGNPERVVSGPFDSQSDGGRATGFTVGGVGWYRKTFRVSDNDLNRAFRIIFDGVYMNSEVWINGHKLGSHPYGYTAFEYDLTDYIRHGQDNVLAVKVSNTGENSRWYSGSGIYRNVHLLVNDKIFHDDWHCIIENKSIAKEASTVTFKSAFRNTTKDTTLLRWRVEVENDSGQQVMIQERQINVFGNSLQEFEMDLLLKDARLWDTDTPNLYTIRSAIYSGIKAMDGYSLKIGLRDIAFSPQKGFLLNGEPVLLKGGNIHHDNGPLGARAFDAAEHRKIKLLKEAGFNAIRTAHNPPSKALLNACDKLGMLVINEAFDVWRVQKKPRDYHLYFDNFWQTDIENMVMRDRNHPSVIMWSIGNDVPERFDPFAPEIAGMIMGKIKKLDNTRPVTAAVNRGDNEWLMADNFFDTLDVAGYNYYPFGYEPDHKRKPHRIIFGSESYPSEAWTYWQKTKEYPHVIGDFVWAAHDYLGEAALGWWSLQDEPEYLFPWTTAYCGDLDLTGNKRPQWYYRNTLWSEEPVVHLFITTPVKSYDERERIAWGWEDVVPRWTWSDFEDLFLEAVIYTNCDEVKLFSNGVEVGSKKLTPNLENRVTMLVKYAPGTLTAVGIVNQQTKATSTLKTAGFPTFIQLKPSKEEIIADGQDLIYVDVEIHDDNDVLNPAYSIPLNFELVGPGEIVGIGNGNPQNTESFQGPVKTTYEGKCQVIIRSTQLTGTINLTVSDIGRLQPGKLAIKSVRSNN